MASGVTFDTKEIDNGFKALGVGLKKATKEIVDDIANEVLRLSQREVPHDTGMLQNSGHVQQAQEGEEPEAIVGYNTVYAARLHEHPEYRFQGGRKGKYLEDPIKINVKEFRRYAEDLLKRIKR